MRGLLSQAVGDVLSSSLDALSHLRHQGRAQGLASTPTSRPNVHSHRLREVIERDRALAASQPLEHEPGSTRDVLAPRAEVIAQAIAESIAEVDLQDGLHAEDLGSEPIQLEPRLTASVARSRAATLPVETLPVTTLPGAATPKGPVVCKEPIRTRTMAKLLASQGHAVRALSIYDFLLQKDASDASMVAEAEALRNAQPS